MKTLAALLLVARCAFGQIAGTVRDSVSKLPVAGVKISLPKQTVESGNLGEFVLGGVPPGKYVVRYSKQGYDNGSTAVEVKTGDERLALEIKPWAEMEGLILDEDGKPLEGVFVDVGGFRDTTNKEGRYHAKQISGGQYTLAFRLPYELRRKTAVRDEKRGETFGYANTLYYPGVADRNLAGSVAIAPGAHMSNFDIRLRRARLVEMKGKVVDALAETEVELDSGGGRPDETYGKRKLDEHGGFRFDLLEPGAYRLVVHRNRAGDALPYIQTVHLGQAGVQDLEVELPAFARIEGVVRTVPPDVKWEGTVSVQLGRWGDNTEVRVGPEGRFAWNAVPPGDWNLMVDANLVHRADDPRRRLYVVGSPRGLLQVRESGNPPPEIKLTDETGRISGTVEEQNVVTVAQVDAAFPFGRLAFPQADGSFAIDVPPGQYRVMIAGGKECSKVAEKVTVEVGITVRVHLKGCGAQ
ncbi:conserved exported hypothetical protein [Candidatus Sulfopaludibacter sp. SbA3]|nr:conserved exported hypothetical protein [Candidatus Sulfopaludibacter sp. SbA3]